jgi:chromosome segregation ATPase
MDETTRKLMAELSTLKSKDELQKRELEAMRIEVEAMRENAHRNDVARQAESVALQAQIVGRDRDIVRLQERIDVLATSTRMANENWTELSALRVQISSMQEERKAAAARLEQQTAERERERNSLRIRETEMGQLRREVDRYRQQVSDLQEKIRSMSVRSGAQPVSKPQVVVPSF